MELIRHLVSNNDGWKLELRQAWEPSKLRKDMRPVAIITGYGMNTFILGYNPSGVSMEEYFAREGFEVWSINFRAQGGSLRVGGSRNYGIADAALTDLRVAADYVIGNTRTGRDRLDLVGCSLGGTYVFTYVSLVPNNPVTAIVSLGGLLRWVNIHPAVRVIFGSPTLAGLVRVRHVRHAAKLFLPLITRFAPRLLEIYIHGNLVDMSKFREIVKTVEDPNPVLNRELSQWIINKDLVVNGRNITEEFRRLRNPLLCVIANGDGIVPPETARSAYDLSPARHKDVFVVGDDRLRFAHADLFVSRYSEEMVFKPIVEWLKKQLSE